MNCTIRESISVNPVAVRLLRNAGLFHNKLVDDNAVGNWMTQAVNWRLRLP